jgi:acetyltransferase-like isoleucine patch superfamily enzyme
MGFLKRLKHRFRYELSRKVKPVMITGLRTCDGELFHNIRWSSTTHFGSIKNIKFSDDIFIGHYNFIEASNGISIGRGCQLTNFISITTHSSHNSIRLYGKEYDKYPEPLGYIKGSISIGEYCFIGPHSVIMPGTKIGKGCIVSAFSYVNGEFPDFSIIAGNPAKITGDTRTADKILLEKFPELKPFYQAWAGSVVANE